MYRYLGDTGIEMYGLFNTFATCIVYFYNFLNFKNKRNLLSNVSLFFINHFSNKRKLNFLKSINFWTVIELWLIIYFQYQLGGFLNKWFGGIVKTGANYYGLIFFVPIILYLFFYVIKINPLKQMDLITPAFPLALVFVKLACFFEGCCSGFEVSRGYYNQVNQRFEFPSQLVEAALALLLFVFLISYKKKAKEGTLFPIYLILYSATRFFSEFTRNDSNILGPLKTYHFLCIGGVIVGIAELLIVLKYSEKIKSIYNRNPFPWIKGKNIIHHTKKKKNSRSSITAARNLSAQKAKAANTRMWVLIWTLGLIGQIGWNVEGTWFNTFVYEKIDKNPSVITPMLICSALATTISIFLFGTLTDRTGKRRTLISTGYIVWGILTMCFGLTQFMPKNFFTLTIICIVLGDMFISFFASMSTDVGYSTWLTDVMNDKNRGQIGGAIAIQCVLGSLLGNIIGGFLVGKDNNYLRLFIIVGTFLSLFGAVSIFLYSKKDDVRQSLQGSYLKQLSGAFDFRKLLKHKELIWVNISVAVFFIGYNTYSPHLGNYVIHYLGFSPDQMGIIQAVPLVLAMIVTIPVSKYINNDKFLQVSLVSIISGLVGILTVFPIKPESVDTTKVFDIRLFLGVFLVGISYIVMLQTTKAWTKKLNPKESRGQYEGLWAISFALIPMFFGSNISEAIVKITGENIFNEMTGRYEYIPNGNIFLIGALISTLSIIPILMAKKYSVKELKEPENSK